MWIMGDQDGRNEGKEEQDSPAETEQIIRADVGHTVIAGVNHSEVMRHKILEGIPIIQEEQEVSLVLLNEIPYVSLYL